MMRTKNKSTAGGIILTLVLALVLAFSMAGCGSQSDGETDADTTVDTEELAGTSLSEGDAAPDFTAELAGGGSFSMSENKGNVILLNFWATWCGPCRDEMPAFEKLYGEYGDKVRILAVDLAEPKADVDQFIEDNGYTFPIAYDETGEIGGLYPTSGIPYTLVIGKDGSIKAVYLGAEGADAQYEKYKSSIEEALNE